MKRFIGATPVLALIIGCGANSAEPNSQASAGSSGAGGAAAATGGSSGAGAGTGGATAAEGTSGAAGMTAGGTSNGGAIGGGAGGSSQAGSTFVPPACADRGSTEVADTAPGLERGGWGERIAP